jgi:signal transduction histidine kinase
MLLRFGIPRRVVERCRRHGAIVVAVGVVLTSLAALAGIAIGERRDDELRRARQITIAETERAGAILNSQQRVLDRLAQTATVEDDTATRRFLDQLPALSPGIRGAAIADYTGAVQFSTANGIDKTVLEPLAADAVQRARAHPGATMLVTQPLRDRETTLVALARPWLATDGHVGGVVLVAIDPATVPGLALLRDDGTPLFGDGGARNRQPVAIGAFPLKLNAPAALGKFHLIHALWAPIVLAALGVAGLGGLLSVFARRLRTAEREAIRQGLIAHELHEKLSLVSNEASRSDELSRAKSHFFAQIAHELRTPLNAILGFSETIRHEMFGPIANPRYREYSGLIHDAGSHLLSLINDLLDSARIEAGKMEIAPIRLSAAALARSALDLVALLAENRDITVSTIGLASCPDLDVDPRAMKQVLVNLLSNAIKYTPPSGRIEVQFFERDDGGATIEIADTGIGMSAEDINLAFEPFGRAGAVEAQRQQGSGLGLSLARALVRLHGGDLTLSSRLNFGTTATVMLPSSAVFSTIAKAPSAAVKAA